MRGVKQIKKMLKTTMIKNLVTINEVTKKLLN